MSKELTVTSLGDAVRDKVKAAIFNSIPDDAIQALITNEFEKLTTKGDRWDNNKRSEIQQMIYVEIQKQVSDRSKQAVIDYIDKTFIVQEKELFEAAIKQIAPLFMAGLMQNFAIAATNDLRNQLSQKNIYIPPSTF